MSRASTAVMRQSAPDGASSSAASSPVMRQSMPDAANTVAFGMPTAAPASGSMAGSGVNYQDLLGGADLSLTQRLYLTSG
jgi:hypothetical protein